MEPTSIKSNDYPVLRKDVRKILLFDSNPLQYALYIQETDRFILLTEFEIDRILLLSKLADGNNTIQNILDLEGSEKSENARLLYMMNQLHLFDNDLSNMQFRETSITSKSIFSVTIPISDSFGLIFYTTYWISLILLMLGFGTLLFFKQDNIIESFITHVNSFNGSGYTLSLVLTIPVSVLHELAHVAMACRFHLNKGININFAFYLYFFPFVYVKIPGLYTIERNKRICVLIAGVCANILLGVLFVIISILTEDNLFFSLAISSFQLAIVNLVPFNLTDGYFILSNILKRGNLRKSYFSFISTIGTKAKIKLNKVELIYIVISASYLIVFATLELHMYFIAFLNGITFWFSMLMSIVSTIVFSFIYVIFLKRRIKKQKDDKK